MPISRRSLLTTSALAIPALAGCGLGGPPMQAKKPGVDLTVWFPGVNTTEIELVSEQIVPEFEEKHDVTVEVAFVDWDDLSPKLNAAFAGGTAPDVFGHGPAAVADFVDQQRIAPLDDRVSSMPEDDVEDMADVFASGKVNDVQYLIPLSVDSQFLTYDMSAFEDAGLDPDKPPSTWQEAREVALELTEREGEAITRSGLSLPTNMPIGIQQSFTTLLYSHGGSMIDEETGASTFATEEGVEALEFLTALHHGEGAVTAEIGVDNSSIPPAQQPLAVGDAAMAIQSPPGVHQLLEAVPDVQLRSAPPLAFDDNSDPAGFGGSGNGLMINVDSPEQDLAWEFIAHITGPEVNLRYVEGIGALPIRASAAENPYVADSPVLRVVQESLPLLRPNPNVPGWVEGRDRLALHLERAVNQQVGAAEALQNATADVSTIFQGR